MRRNHHAWSLSLENLLNRFGRWGKSSQLYLFSEVGLSCQNEKNAPMNVKQTFCSFDELKSCWIFLRFTRLIDTVLSRFVFNLIKHNYLHIRMILNWHSVWIRPCSPYGKLPELFKFESIKITSEMIDFSRVFQTIRISQLNSMRFLKFLLRSPLYLFRFIWFFKRFSV